LTRSLFFTLTISNGVPPSTSTPPFNLGSIQLILQTCILLIEISKLTLGEFTSAKFYAKMSAIKCRCSNPSCLGHLGGHDPNRGHISKGGQGDKGWSKTLAFTP